MEEYVSVIAELIETRENYQRMLGKIASTVTELYGSNSLEELSTLVENTVGRKISPSTLRNYRWVYERTVSLNLPEDLTYRALQLISSSEDPSYWANRVINDGLSSKELTYLIEDKRGLNKRRRGLEVVICQNCGKEVKVK